MVVVVSGHSEGAMLLYLIKFFVVLVDIQTLITILAANLIKDPRHIYFWAIIAALIGEGIALYLGHEDFVVFYLRLIGQLMLGIYIVKARRKKGAFNKTSTDILVMDNLSSNMGRNHESK